MGMVYLHRENVLHGDLKALNVLVSNNGRCVVSDFGQSEMKWGVSRRSRKPITNGTLRWQAPELPNGATQLTPAMDVYTFSICYVEILGMGDLPCGHRDDKLVALLVLDQDKRAKIPSTRLTALTEPLIQECWVRDPLGQRPAFTHVAARLKQFRKRQGGVVPCSNAARTTLFLCFVASGPPFPAHVSSRVAKWVSISFGRCASRTRTFGS
ncbi:kinase-like protein [Rhizopogon salebrosus TDB-379]|nr:kinase-like protein [Rhizopogon salebrosus TDB-379]